MIVDVLPNKYEAFACKHTFHPWQTGLLAKMVVDNKEQVLSLNMGTGAGHTYFTRIAAIREFPTRTKIYVTRQDNLLEFSNLLFDDTKVHEPIELLTRKDFTGYDGTDPVDFVVIDLNGEHPQRFKRELGFIKNTVSSLTKILLLQPNFLIF